jgi:hypothetical protein
MKAFGTIIKKKELEFTIILTVRDIMGNGKIVKDMEKEY